MNAILLKKLKFDTAIDIGSNYGSYTSILRIFQKGYINRTKYQYFKHSKKYSDIEKLIILMLLLLLKTKKSF